MKEKFISRLYPLKKTNAHPNFKLCPNILKERDNKSFWHEEFVRISFPTEMNRNQERKMKIENTL